MTTAMIICGLIIVFNWIDNKENGNERAEREDGGTI